MTFQLRPAVREKTPVIIGLAGPSKSGKTYSALRLATGLANGGRIGMINTEGRRGHLYAERFKYEAIDIEEPFGYDRYREAMLALKSSGVAVGVIDSISHAHEGPGGMLDQHEQDIQRRAGDDYKKREKVTWTAWIKPKAQEAIFVNTMIQVDFPIILCFRAKEKLLIVKGQDPVPLGWQPICSDRIPFETTATLILPPGSKGVPDLTAKGSELREPLDTMIGSTQIDEELGRKLSAWAAGGAVRSTITEDQTLELGKLMVDCDDLASAAFCKIAKIERLDQLPAADYAEALDWVQRRKAKPRK